MAHPLRFQGLALAALCAMASTIAYAQPADPPATQQSASELEAAMEAEDRKAALTAELFYEILVSEMAAREGALNDAQALMMEAARGSNNEKLYRRGTEMAVQSRSGTQALRNARAWLAAYPESREANRAVLRLLVAMNRVADSASYLRREVELSAASERGPGFLSLPQLYANVSDKSLAADIVEQALQEQLKHPKNGATAWAALGHMRLAAGQKPAALMAMQSGEKLSPGSSDIAVLAMTLLEAGSREAEPLVQRYLQKNANPQLRMAYIRMLSAQKRTSDALLEAQALVRETPQSPEAWILLANLQLQSQELDEAEQSIAQLTALQSSLPDDISPTAVQAQLYLLQASLAEKRQRYDEADAYLQRIPNASQLMSVQARRAELMARQGKLEQARAIIRATPAPEASQQRLKLLAEVQLLREAQQHAQAYELQASLQRQQPGDVELAYDTAMLAEKAGKTEEMERLLRDIIARAPSFQHAYNALGYFYADRNIRLEEAQALIEKALDLSPGDPFITDSLAWVHFRRGNLAEAEKLLEQAYATRADAEIAAHLGEVLWLQNKRSRAQKIWREGLQVDPSNTTLQETLQRLGVKP